MAKNLLGLKIKKYRTGKAQKRNDYSHRYLHSIISRNKNPRQHTETNINQTLTAAPCRNENCCAGAALRNDCVNLNGDPDARAGLALRR
ncbi:hypothetical protein GKN89_11355 [Serratia sp. YC16]|uniref:hypothetical protein n=1 Tax=Serratia sp. YC16 TaxID=2675312 RepID=UPI0012B9F204|nr:hypothetical protein [Serratia sp. YC16]MTD07325.1 hypothetical protein [Serratia sp. YC16]